MGAPLKTYASILAQAQEVRAKAEKQAQVLEEEAQRLKNRERVGQLVRARELVEHYEFTFDELFGPPPELPQTAARVVKNKGKLPTKYRDGNGNEWSGLGHMPTWMKAHLSAGGAKSDFAVNPGQS